MKILKKISLIIKRNKTHLLGIDIRSNFIRLVELSWNKSEYEVTACICSTINGPSISDQVVINAVKNLLKKKRFKTKNVATALAHTVVIFQEMQIDPGLTAEEMENFLCFNLMAQMGDNKNKINFDYQVDATRKNGIVKVVAVPQEVITKQVKLLQAVKFQPKIIDVDVYAIERAIRWQVRNIAGLVAVINIDGNHILTVVIDSKKIVYMGEDFLPEQSFASIAQIVEKIECKLQVASSAVSQLWQQIVLAGEKANLIGLTEAVFAKLHVQTIIANPFLGMHLSANVSSELVNQVAPMMLISGGLALRVADDFKN